MKKDVSDTRVRPKIAVGYGFGEIGSQTIWYMVSSYLLLFYTDVLTLSAVAISAIMIIARIWDAANDPLMGMLCDRTMTKWGKFRPYLLIAPPFLAVFNVLTFTVFPVSGAAKVILALVCYICAGMFYTVVSTAYAGLVTVLSKNSQKKQNLAAARTAGGSLAQFILSVVAMPMILYFGHSDVATAKGYFWTVLIFSVISVPCIWVTAFVCKEKYTRDLHGDFKPEGQTFFGSLKVVFTNDQMVLVLIAGFMLTLATMWRTTLLSYYVIYVMGSYSLLPVILGVTTLSGLFFSLLIPRYTRSLGKKTWLVTVNVLMIIGYIAMYLADPGKLPVIIVLSVLCGAGNSGQGIIFGMLSDAIDYGEWKHGKREEGISFAFLSFSVKIATAIVGSAGVLALAYFGYEPNAVQTAEAMDGIKMTVNLIPAVLAILGMIPMFLYNLSPKKMDSILGQLEERRLHNKK